ncbi:MAG: ATP-dependent DNA helicase [Patescibacteria group bacterium]
MTLGTAKFDQLYAALNPAQKEAVDAIDGPVLVVAGPGTGKTQVLTLRIANILRQTDTSPDSILALTFTRSGVQSMRQRLAEIVGSVAYRVGIYTFHGFCHDVIGRYPDYFLRIVGATAATPVDQIKLLEGIIGQPKLRLQRLRPPNDPFYYLRPVLSAIEHLKKENMSPREFKKLITTQARTLAAAPDRYHQSGPYRGRLKASYRDRDQQMVKNFELAKIYSAYERALAAARLYDFSDMIMEVLQAAALGSDLLFDLQEQYQYLLADEHQDANHAQNQLLERLASFHSQPNLFIVGDDKQAIYQFQGASLDNFRYFRRLYPAARLIALTNNYRSTQHILDSAHHLIGHSQGLDSVVHVPLRSRTKKSSASPVIFRSFATASDELSFVAKDIAERRAAGQDLSQIAVLYRDNQDGLPLAAALAECGVPSRLESETNVLADLDLAKLAALLRAVHYFGQDDYLLAVLPIDFLGLGVSDLAVLKPYADRHGLTVYELLRSKQKLRNAGVRRVAKLRSWYRRLARLRRVASNQHFLDLFGQLLTETNFLAHLLERPDSILKLARLQSFFTVIKRLSAGQPDYRLANFIAYLDLVEAHQLSIPIESELVVAGARLMTVHRAKGLEFDYVYIINAYDGHFGNRRQRSRFLLPGRGVDLVTSDRNDDERRLFYVALTRARYGVTISYFQTVGDDRLYLPSQFIEEIGQSNLRVVRLESSLPVASYFRLSPPQESKIDQPLIKHLLGQRGFSATALNNYLRCPRRYFFQNLLRLTSVQNRATLYGQAVHATLKDVFDGRPSPALMLRRWRHHVARLPLGALDRELLARRGRAALTGYLKSRGAAQVGKTINELKIPPIILPATAGLKIKGMIDKLEIAADGRTVTVVDYKTGRPRSGRDVAGLNKGSSGDYRRQLVFYRLLLDHFADGRYRAEAGEIDFVEPDQAGNYHKYRLPITAQEMADLEKLLHKTAAEILDLEFVHRGCDDPQCPACRLWSMSSWARIRSHGSLGD